MIIHLDGILLEVFIASVSEEEGANGDMAGLNRYE